MIVYIWVCAEDLRFSTTLENDCSQTKLSADRFIGIDSTEAYSAFNTNAVPGAEDGLNRQFLCLQLGNFYHLVAKINVLWLHFLSSVSCLIGWMS